MAFNTASVPKFPTINQIINELNWWTPKFICMRAPGDVELQSQILNFLHKIAITYLILEENHRQKVDFILSHE